MSDVEEFHLRKNDHVITFKWDGNGVETGSWFVASGAVDMSNCLLCPCRIDIARNIWACKIEEGYQRIK